jgi:hypothetical protein
MGKISLRIFIIVVVWFNCFFAAPGSGNPSDSGPGYAGTYESRVKGSYYRKGSDSSNPLNLLENRIEKTTKTKAEKIFGTSNVLEKPPSKEKNLVETDRLINDFFSYLDHQGYVRSRNLSGGSRKQFFQICESLFTESPVTIRETDSLQYLLKNVFHFYRTLGRKRIVLINDVLKNESDIVEPMLRLFYMRFTAFDGIRCDGEVCPTLEQLYEYVSFFLETLGGRNYLFRRDPTVRILAQYYCVLLIDEANDQGYNPNGIDIRPHIRHMLDEISDQKNLLYKGDYLTELEKLKLKYETS